jgi:hypothetical protein
LQARPAGINSNQQECQVKRIRDETVLVGVENEGLIKIEFICTVLK